MEQNEERQRYLQLLHSKKAAGERLVGVAAGSGITGKYAIMGGCDMLLALSSGKFRSMGCGSLAGYMSYRNSNDLVMSYAGEELLRYAAQVPVFFGLNATDSTKEMQGYIEEIRAGGFTGIVNYPTVGMIDGSFRQQLEASGAGYHKEVEAIRYAHSCGLMTIAFVFDGEQAMEMAAAGADIICAHFGLTRGGYVGAGKALSLEKARITAVEIFEAAERISANPIKMIYGGPVKTPVDAEYIYLGSGCDGYIGGSVFERTPVEAALLKAVHSFKEEVQVTPASRAEGILFENPGRYDYVEFIKEYIAENYMEEIRLGELAQSLHLSASYLSTLFSKNVGSNFQSYLIEVRMKKARKFVSGGDFPLLQVAQMVGYQDYAQFSKMYKNVWGNPPRDDLPNKKK